MIQLDNIHLTRGGKSLLTDASMTIHHGQHVGLTGANGCGKSSLFSLIHGEVHPDSGNVSVPKSSRIVHMAQEIKALERAAVEYVIDGDTALRNIEKKIEIATASDNHDTLATLYEQLEVHDGYTANTRAEQLLHGLGFRQEQLNDAVSSFSGGWRMRLNLARTLMCPSDIMLLDEPTNHLDLEAILWLESWLRQYPGTLICISHDRAFLDGIADYIAHIEQSEITLYSGNYTAFEKARAEKLMAQQAVWEKQQRKKAHLQGFVDRFRAKASKARQAQSRLKAMEKMEALSPAHVNSPFSFVFNASDKMSDPLLSIRDASIGYGNETPLLEKINISFHPDTRIGLLGPNGTGKSSLIKAIAGKTAFRSGAVTRGEHLKIGYFAQHQIESLDLEASSCLHIQRLSPLAREQETRDFLGRYNFHGDQVMEPVKGFSGGEQARLALALIAWQKPNLLLLDEPTNHLDLEMRYALTMALQAFEGAVVLVSHDRSLMEAVAGELWLVHDRGVNVFDGDLDSYSKWYKTHERDSRQKKPSAGGTKKVSQKILRQQKAGQKKEHQKLERNIKKIEERLAEMTKKHNETSKALEDPTLYEKGEKDRLALLLEQQTTLQKEMQTLEESWLMACESMESMIKNDNPHE